MIEIAGVTVPRAAVARLAARLQHEGEKTVSYRLGNAIDQNVESIALTAHEMDVILATLTADPATELEPLRDRLLEGDRPLRGTRRLREPPSGTVIV